MAKDTLTIGDLFEFAANGRAAQTAIDKIIDGETVAKAAKAAKDAFGDHPLVHSQPLVSETEALEKVQLSLNSMRAAILAAVRGAGENGLTPDEYADRHDKLINTVRRRFVDLWKDGYIRHHPKEDMRLNSAGNKCVVWVEGYDPDAGTKSRIARLRKQLLENGIKPCC